MKYWILAAAVAVIVLGMAFVHERQSREAIIIESVIGVSARCADGMYSASSRDAGTCSGHGGVDYWIIKKGP